MSVDPGETAAAEQQARSKTAGRLLLLYAAAWVFEGALRKWVAPGAQQLIFFVRVPVVLLILNNSLRFSRGRLPGGGGPAALLIMGLAAFSAIHVLVLGQDLVSAALGLRQYVEPWLVPLCLARDLRREAVQVLLRCVAILSGPLAVLALLQANSPRSAFVNRIFQEGGADNFGLVANTIRPTSTFTSSAGHGLFVILSVAVALGLYLQPRAPRDRILAGSGAVAAGVMVATAGSRGALLGSALALVIVAIVQAYRQPDKLFRFGIGVTVVAAAAVFLGPKVAPQQINGLIERFSYTGAGGELQNRSVGAFTDWISSFETPNLLGDGLGSLTGGLANRQSARINVEGELIRQLFELGPPLFLVALAARFWACGYIALRALKSLRSTRSTADAIPVVMTAAAVNTWLAGPATGQGSVTGFVAVTAACALVSRSETKQLTNGEGRLDAHQTTSRVRRR